jgi:hypothetical protein
MLTKSHGKRDKRERKAKKLPVALNGKAPTMSEKYNKTDETVTLVYVDIANGVSRSDCLQKIQEGLYGNNPVKARQSAYIYNAALDRFAEDRNIEAEKLRDMFFGRYESLLADAIKKGDLYNARGILDSMSRIFGVEKKDAPQTAIQINNNKEGIVVNFGFNEDDDETELSD